MPVGAAGQPLSWWDVAPAAKRWPPQALNPQTFVIEAFFTEHYAAELVQKARDCGELAEPLDVSETSAERRKRLRAAGARRSGRGGGSREVATVADLIGADDDDDDDCRMVDEDEDEEEAAVGEAVGPGVLMEEEEEEEVEVEEEEEDEEAGASSGPPPKRHKVAAHSAVARSAPGRRARSTAPVPRVGDVVRVNGASGAKAGARGSHGDVVQSANGWILVKMHRSRNEESFRASDLEVVESATNSATVALASPLISRANQRSSSGSGSGSGSSPGGSRGGGSGSRGRAQLSRQLWCPPWNLPPEERSLHAQLYQTFGLKSFREGQLAPIQFMQRHPHNNLLVIMPTGSGTFRM